MEILFMGSGQFAVEVLKKINASSHPIRGVISQCCKPVGRKREIKATLVSECCDDSNIPVYEADTSDEVLEILKDFDLTNTILVVADYGVLLSEKVLDLFEYKLNVHGSILPKYRGASPIQTALLNNDAKTGVSIMTMVKALDAGAVWKDITVPIEFTDTCSDLIIKLGNAGGDALIDVLDNIKNLSPIEQDHDKATFTTKIKKQDGCIDLLQDPFWTIVGKYRAYNIWPTVFFEWNNLRIQIVKMNYTISDVKRLDPPATIKTTKDTLILDYKGGRINITEIKPAGKSNMTVQAFLLGRPDFFDVQ